MNGTPGQRTIGGGSYNSAAIASAQKLDWFAFALQSYLAGQLFQSLFQVDPQCPFFYIFAGGGISTATNGPAFTTLFEFLNGGSVVTSILTAWGDSATLNEGSTSYASVITTPNDGIVYIHDNISQTCPSINPGTGDQLGFVKRWTSLVDSVRATTALVAPFDNSAGEAFQILHGVLQQPW